MTPFFRARNVARREPLVALALPIVPTVINYAHSRRTQERSPQASARKSPVRRPRHHRRLDPRILSRLRGITTISKMAAILGTAVLSAFVVLPLVGWPAVIRVAPIVLCVAMILLVAVRPWTWSATEWARVRDWNPSRRIVRAISVAVGLILFWFVLTRFRSGEINAIDFTVYYDRPNFQTMLGRPLYVESADDAARAYRTYLAVHAHWIMLPLAALYFLWATPLWLLALSVVAVVVGAVYTLRIIQNAGGGGVLGSAAALAFVLNDNTARTLNYGFHTEVLYAWFVPWMIHAGMLRQWKSFGAATLACIAVKEDAFLLVFGVAAVLLLVPGRSLQRMEWLFVAASIAVATLNLMLYYQFLVPRLSPTGAPLYANYWANYGPTAMTALVGMLQHPGTVLLSTLTSGFMTRVMVPHLYLPFVGWRWMLGIAPIIFLYGSSANEQLRSFGIYYAIVVVPFLVLGAATGAERCAGLLVKPRGKALGVAATVIVFGALIAGISNAGYSIRPWKPEITALPDLLRKLPPDQIVLVQSGLYPHAGYASRIQVLTKDTLNDSRYARAMLVLAPGVSAYPLTSADIEHLNALPVTTRGPSGLIAVQRMSER